jgi:UTP:GlnB (protein PII) uridylyltransferase
VRAFLDTLSEYYIRNTPSPLMAEHFGLWQRMNREGLVAEFGREALSHYSRLTICTGDKVGLLRDVTGTLTANGVGIYLMRIEVSTSAAPFAVITLWVDAGGRRLNEEQARQITEHLRAIVLGGTSVRTLMAQRGQIIPDVVALQSLEVRNDLSRRYTLVRIGAVDQLGLLFRLSEALAAEGLAVHAVMAKTWRDRADDDFYITTAKGDKLPDTDCAAVRDRLEKRLRGF